MAFEQSYPVLWSHLDPNGHMRHTAYNDFGAQLRLDYFASQGSPMDKILESGVGPILFREDTRFFREVAFGEIITLKLLMTKLREDGSKWSMEHGIYKTDGELACTIQVDGSWLDLNKRKVTPPPLQMQQTLLDCPRSEDFEWIPPKNQS